jgi:hypothetical protein
MLARYEEAGCHRFVFGDLILPKGGKGQRILERIAKNYIN